MAMQRLSPSWQAAFLAGVVGAVASSFSCSGWDVTNEYRRRAGESGSWVLGKEIAASK